MNIDRRDLLRMQELFHGLIRSRAQEGGLQPPADLPELEESMLTEGEPRWFPVPGMHGGFSFRLQITSGAPSLSVESWCRVVDGSGLRHLITPKEVRLEQEGFV